MDMKTFNPTTAAEIANTIPGVYAEEKNNSVICTYRGKKGIAFVITEDGVENLAGYSAAAAADAIRTAIAEVVEVVEVAEVVEVKNIQSLIEDSIVYKFVTEFVKANIDDDGNLDFSTVKGAVIEKYGELAVKAAEKQYKLMMF